MTANYVLLEKITVGAAGASSVTFSGIPQTGYTDLVVKMSGRNTDTSGLVYYSFNGNASSRTARLLYGDGSAAGSVTYDNTDPRAMIMNQSNYTASTFSNGEMYIPNYTGSTNKSWSSDSVQETNATTAFSYLLAGLWSNTAAITSITFSTFSGTFAANSTFYLYGVAKLGTTPAIVPYATGGDTIMTDGTYWYHTFISSGTFTPQKAISCDYLVVAGGGGGGTLFGAGGGAGGLRSTVTATGGGGTLETALALASGTGYTVTIGAGGNGGTGGANSTNGNNSVFSTITSTGGGAGAGNDLTLNGQQSGGSGGGARSSNTGAAGTANQGYAGGNGAGEAGAGGGGAGSVGQNAASSSVPGNGGSGVSVSITGSSVGYAGGGGGSGSGGSGTASSGGGAAGSAGTANTGGGGGAGSSVSSSGKNGGSGIVIIRYAV
jgi:hypothetical protein